MKEKISRSDIRITNKYLIENPSISVFLALLCFSSAAASVAGLLRWQAIFLKYSFSFLMVIFAFYCIERAISGFKLKSNK